MLHRSPGPNLAARSWLVLGCMLLPAMLLAGCSSDNPPEWAGVQGDNKPAKLAEISEVAKVAERWHASIGDSGINQLRPAVTNDGVYGVSANGELTRFDHMGKEIWRVASGLSVSGGVAGGGGVVVIGSDKGDVYAYDEDSKLRWKARVSSEVLSVAPVTDDVVMVRTGDGRITGLSIIDGKRIWVYEHTTPALVVRSHAALAVQRGVAYAGFAGGRLTAIRIRDGEVLWESFVSQPNGITELERINDITSDPVVDDDQVCAVAFQGRVACFDLAQGNILWSRDISSDKGLALAGKNLYLTDDKGSVFALDKATGGTVWKNDQLFMRRVTAPCAVGDFVVAGDYEGYLHILNREDGKLIGRMQLLEEEQVSYTPIDIAPLPLDDGVLAATHGGELYSLTVRK